MLPEAECIRLISEVSRILNLEHVWFRINHCGLLILCILQVCGILDEPTQRKVWKILADHSNLEVCVHMYMYVYRNGNHLYHFLVNS